VYDSICVFASCVLERVSERERERKRERERDRKQSICSSRMMDVQNPGSNMFL
jgi:hypothetical protein